MTERLELLEATDEAIEDALTHADIMALRGLVYQLTGDERVGATEVTMTVQGFIEVMDITSPSGIALLRSKAAEFLKSYRNQGAPDISIGPADRLLRRKEPRGWWNVA